MTLRSTLTPPAMFASAQAALFEMGFSFTRVDSSGMNLETDAAPVGSSKSPLRVTLHVESNPTGSLLTITGRTPVAGGVWGTATNSHTDGKARLGFEEMVLLLVRLPHREIQYPLAEAPR